MQIYKKPLFYTITSLLIIYALLALKADSFSPVIIKYKLTNVYYETFYLSPNLPESCYEEVHVKYAKTNPYDLIHTTNDREVLRTNIIRFLWGGRAT